MGKWNLDILYTGFDTVEFKNDMDRLNETIPEYIAHSEKASTLSPKELLTEYVRLSEELSELSEKIGIYASLRTSANTRDSEAASMLGRLMAATSATAAPGAVIEKAISEIPNLEEIVDSTPELAEYIDAPSSSLSSPQSRSLCT